MEAPKKYDRKAAIKASYKSSYGNRQAGRGQALIAKDALKKKYELQKYKEELRKRKQQYYATEKQEVSEAELRFLPAMVRDDPEQKEEEQDEDNQNKRKKYSKLTRAKFEFKRNVSERQQQKAEQARLQQEKQARLKAKKEEALRRNKCFSQKTKRGQPLMSARMDLLIEKINSKWGDKKQL
ncbi:hypothetical protein HAZT_HAZT008605 [Hyalella azteca]|uniref:rRNA-processing protein FYV7 n=1 Tax=Hyalella azteca TaxID=294128 RepID=A0A6A0GSS8_HYAAZ|nr:rRNA-processing protein FYV7 [Hyalella azteca]KAA0185566.1 hypothetical protein HAZT_HAZT008605 [Hyalella azteca]